MNKISSLLIASSIVVFFAGVGPVHAQSSEEAAGQAAEQGGKLREALNYYVVALQQVPEATADDQRLRETIIELVQLLSPPPDVPRSG